MKHASYGRNANKKEENNRRGKGTKRKNDNRGRGEKKNNDNRSRGRAVIIVTVMAQARTFHSAASNRQEPIRRADVLMDDLPLPDQEEGHIT